MASSRPRPPEHSSVGDASPFSSLSPSIFLALLVNGEIELTAVRDLEGGERFRFGIDAETHVGSILFKLKPLGRSGVRLEVAISVDDWVRR